MKKHILIPEERFLQLLEAEKDCAKAEAEWGKAAFLVGEYEAYAKRRESDRAKVVMNVAIFLPGVKERALADCEIHGRII